MQNNSLVTSTEASESDRRALLADLIATIERHPHMTVNDALNGLLQAAANIIAHREKSDRRDYVAVRGFRQILEDVRRMQKAAAAVAEISNH